MVKPYSSNEAAQAQNDVMPEIVVETVNRLLARCVSIGRIVIKQRELVALLIKRGESSRRIFTHDTCLISKGFIAGRDGKLH